MALTEAEAEAAAGVTSALIGDFLSEGTVEAVEAPAEVSSTAITDTAPDLDIETEEALSSYDLSPTLPDDIARELAEAEIDAEVEAVLSTRNEDEYAFAEESEEEVRERVRLQKRNEYLEAELTRTKAGSWKAEATKYFPLAKHALDNIQANSRRAFLKQAKAEHDRILPYVQEALSEARTAVDRERAAARLEGRQAAAAAFGQPLSGPDTTAIDQAAANSAIDQAREKARRTGSLADVFKTMINVGK